ncbi:MAG: division/cell wall cluster transcriptional repressor MraZ [Chloroflexi bacterium]|nr:division/cell wall cluster transcriptional repressor MraZ [Chloroflexota bacterium]
MTTFVGQATYKVDEKGRIPIPPSFRSALQEGGFLTPGAEGCIAIYTKAKFEEIAQTLQTKGLAPAAQRKVQRNLFPKATEFKLDAQGRVMLPPELRQTAGIETSAIVIGVNESAEIWNPERLKAFEQDQSSVWDVIESLQKPRGQQE